MPKGNEYRAKAEACERQAASAHDRRVKAQFEDLARQWRELAAIADDVDTLLKTTLKEFDLDV